MAGINLSQSMMQPEAPKSKRVLFDSGFVVSFIIFVLVISVWGGLRLYNSSLNKNIAGVDEVIANHTLELQGRNVDRVADFDARLQYISENSKENVSPEEVFRQLESLVVPSIMLSAYEYNKTEKVITLSGVTDNYRFLAEQIIALKSERSFSEVKVDTIGRNKQGRITFTLKIPF